MKISSSLPAEDVAFLDGYAARTGSRSRSAALHSAVALLRERDLEEQYAEAWEEWNASPDAPLWDATVGDGLNDGTR